MPGPVQAGRKIKRQRRTRRVHGTDAGRTGLRRPHLATSVRPEPEPGQWSGGGRPDECAGWRRHRRRHVGAGLQHAVRVHGAVHIYPRIRSLPGAPGHLCSGNQQLHRVVGRHVQYRLTRTAGVERMVANRAGLVDTLRGSAEGPGRPAHRVSVSEDHERLEW